MALSRGLVRRKQLDRNGRDETRYLRPLEESVARGITPAEALLEKFHCPWKGSVRPMFEDYAYYRANEKLLLRRHSLPQVHPPPAPVLRRRAPRAAAGLRRWTDRLRGVGGPRGVASARRLAYVWVGRRMPAH